MDIVAVNNFGDTRSGGLAGPMGLFIIVLLSIATVLLIRNMNKRLRRLPDSFPNSSGVTRDAEGTKSDAGLAQGDGTAGPLPVDEDRSLADDRGAESEVAAVESEDASAKNARRGDHA